MLGTTTVHGIQVPIYGSMEDVPDDVRANTLLGFDETGTEDVFKRAYSSVSAQLDDPAQYRPDAAIYRVVPSDPLSRPYKIAVPSYSSDWQSRPLSVRGG